MDCNMHTNEAGLKRPYSNNNSRIKHAAHLYFIRGLSISTILKAVLTVFFFFNLLTNGKMKSKVSIVLLFCCSSSGFEHKKITVHFQ